MKKVMATKKRNKTMNRKYSFASTRPPLAKPAFSDELLKLNSCSRIEPNLSQLENKIPVTNYQEKNLRSSNIISKTKGMKLLQQFFIHVEE